MINLDNIVMKDQKIRIAMAIDVINEIGGVAAVNRLFPDVSRSSIHLWKLRGIPVDKERFLRSSYPHLKVWEKFSYRSGLQ